MFVTFKREEPRAEWNGRVAGIDINPAGVACTVVSEDGNLIATRFFGDNRLVSAVRNKRKWVLEDTVNRMLRWCSATYHCNAIAIENLNLSESYDSSTAANFKLSNFMRTKMLRRIRLGSVRLGLPVVEVDPAYSSLVALAKYGKRFGGANRHQLAAFVIARRALGFGEAPPKGKIPASKSEHLMWKRSSDFYGHSSLTRTLPSREPLEWKNGGDVNEERVVTELPKAPPATTSHEGRLSHFHTHGEETLRDTINRRAGRARPNGQASRGDGARGRRENPPDDGERRSAVMNPDRENNDLRYLFYSI